jgi:DNA-binding NarL/FixJ family response regulator
MKNILMVENSPELLKTIKQAFKKYESQLNLIVAENGEEAINTLAETSISVVITDLYVPKVDGLELLAHMSRHHSDTPIIMTAFGSPELMDILANLGIHQFLEKPFKANALIKAVSEAINKKKPLESISLAGFLRLLQEEQRSCVLEVDGRESRQGCFYLIDGRLYDAEYDGLQGEEAAMKILGWQKFSLNLKALESEDIPARIHISLKALITKAEELRKAEQKTEPPKPEKQSAQTAEKDLKKIILQGIGQAQSGHLITAHNTLAKVLKSNPKVSTVWLWLARTADNLKTINAALSNAATLAPDDADIKAEIEKLKSALNSGCGEAARLKHCPFCWAPVVEDKSSCHYCHAHLDIHEDFFHAMFFSSEKEPDLKIIEKSFQRFAKVKAQDPNNPHPYFFLAMAHINFNHWEEALAELSHTREIATDNNPYHKQLDILIDFMGDLESFFSPDDDQ